MIYQNDSECLPIIQKVGCFVRACGAIAEFKYNELHPGENAALTAEDINKMWNWGKSTGIITPGNCLMDSAKMATYAFRILGEQDKTFIEIGTKKKNLVLYPWVKKFGYVPESYIQKIKQNGPSGTHFRVVDKDDRLIFDPHSPEIKMIKPMYTIAYAIN